MFERGWIALMRRNLIYRKRNWLASLGEFLLPILFCLLLVALKETAEKSDHFRPRQVEAQYPSDIQAIQIFSFTDYATALQAKRVCLNTTEDNKVNRLDLLIPGVSHHFDISGMREHSRNWQVPFIQCDSRRCQYHGEEAYEYCHYPKLGLAASDLRDQGGMQRAQQFQEYLYQRYPQLTNTSLPATKGGDFVRLFESSQALEDYIQHPEYGVGSLRPKLAMAIIFSGNDKQNYNYTIRVNSTNKNAPEWSSGIGRTTPDTNRLFASFAKREVEACGKSVLGRPQGPLQYSCTGQYILNGLLTMQRLLHDWIMVDTGAHDTGLFVSEHGVKFVPFPSNAFSARGFYAILKDFLPLMLTLGFLYPCASMISYIASERELGQKEFLKIMSAKEWEIGSSWFCTFFSLHFVTATVLSHVSSTLFEHSDRAILWMFWQSSFLAVITFSSCIPSLIFRQAKTSSRTVLIGLLVFLAGYFISQAVNLQDSDPTWLRILSLHPAAAFGFGVQEIGRLEDAVVGATWKSFQSTDSPSGFTVMTAIQFLWLDCLLGTILSWYCNRVIPLTEGGHTLACSFPFRSSYWFNITRLGPSSGESAPLQYAAARMDEDIPIEPVSDSFRSQAKSGCSIEIHNLRKVFPSKVGPSITAVNGISLSLHQGQVTALLGHNGSGKSTTINLLTCSLLPTDGCYVVAGYHSSMHRKEIRENIGICLQHNDCLFAMLTVRETVKFFMRLKGKPPTDEMAEEALQEVGLQDKSESLVSVLSGGMKRKLCVAVAFSGNSKVIILDEPTSGMDPFSRRLLWNTIKKKRHGRIILLTTHFLDEADILADKIAILANGTVQCVGSPMFLKKTFGVGYQLVLEKTICREDSKGYNNGSQCVPYSSEELFDETQYQNLEDIVMKSVGEAKLLTKCGNELSFHLPLESASSFSIMLRNLETEVKLGRLTSFGISMTTLHEVFQRITEASLGRQHVPLPHPTYVHQETNKKDYDIKSDEKSGETEPSNVSEGNIQLQQMAALLRKRKINFTRDKKSWCCTTLVPSVFVLAGFLSLKYASPDRVLEPLSLELKDYNPDISLGMTTKNRNPVAFNQPGTQFKCQPGWCSYLLPIIEEKETNEMYFYCGAQSYLLSSPNCSQDYSSKILSRSEFTPIPHEVSNINESSRSILHSAGEFASTQYGAIYFTNDPNSTIAPGINYGEKVSNQCLKIKDQYMLDKECMLYNGLGYVISYNFTALHVSPLFQKLADEAIIREAIGDDSLTINPTIHPLPRTQAETGFSKQEDVFNLWFMMIMSFPFIGGHVATFIVNERQSKAKHLQAIAGVRPVTYWLSNLIWDTLNYQIPLWFTVILMYSFHVDVFTTTAHGTFEGVLLLLFLFGPASAAFAYCISFMFTSGSLCNIFIIIIGFITGMVGPISSFTLRLIGSDPEYPLENLLHSAKAIELAGLFFPSFCMGKGLFYTINIRTIEMRVSKELSVWEPSILLNEVIALGLQTIGYLLLAVFLDSFNASQDAKDFCYYFKSFLTCSLQATATYQACATEVVPQDGDVADEEGRIQLEQGGDDVVVMKNVTKVFGNGKVAVDNLSLGIRPGECFGILGTNGAGKSTTISILTCEFPPSSGQVILAGPKPNAKFLQLRIGYCPQFDAIFENLTGQEQVEFYAAIKGVDPKYVESHSAIMLSQVGISERDKGRLSSHYSGGTKRKLSMACAMIGDPDVVFFDEVSTGIDPVSRCEIWQTITQWTTQLTSKTNQKKCAILTTHSMEECEALCSRIGIMSRGRLLCLGSAQRLKSKFGHGYQLELRIKPVEAEDNDFAVICEKLSFYQRSMLDVETTQCLESVFFELDQTHAALASITGDESLSSMIATGNVVAAGIFNEACSANGVGLPILASFVALELRMQCLDRFVSSMFPGAAQRERQDMTARYEVGATNTSLADIFSTIEDNKRKLWLSEYGVNQTTLEQVFNTLVERDSGHVRPNPHQALIV